MSAEHNASRSPVRRNVSFAYSANISSNANDTLEETAGSADNSIIGKVKSRVSSIIPSSLSKWFSPSTRNNDSLNGNVSIGSVRRRRRLELEEDDEEADDDGEEDDAEQTHGEYVEHSLGGRVEQDTDEESNNSEEDSAVVATSPVRSVHRHVKPPSFGQQPPTKRSRISFDVTDMHDSPLMQHQPLISSTPAVVSNMRGSANNLYSPSGQQIQARSATTNRYAHLNLYGQRGVREAPYIFLSTGGNGAQREARRDAGDTTDLVASPGLRLESGAMRNETNEDVMGISTRRALNLPSTSHAAAERYSAGGSSSLKRQSLASVKYEMVNSAQENYHSSPSAAVPSRTSTTILEIEAGGSDDDEVLAGEIPSKINGRPVNHTGSKRQKLINGTGGEFSNTTAPTNMDGDSASESSEGGGVNTGVGTEMPGSVTTQRKPGLFNTSATHSRNGSRTSSFGNGINFYSHLEGRKSLFSGNQHGAGVGSNTLNNSTLSLTSLNRRQFNASIYGSTSALSDSRLLSTFSPFYKGKTTYGGAAAYNKYTAAGIAGGPGANAVRITPTLIRPTSSLSTLSSSNNSLVATGGASTSAGVGGEGSSAISSTAKRILDLINDFATPLSDAKKMANNLKTNQQQQQHPQLTQTKGKSRLSDADVHAARAVRLQQVRTPYMRPAVMLQPNKGVLLPPVRELQVPSMSQLLQMKKMQSSTERARQITTQNNSMRMGAGAGGNVEYALPVVVESNADGQRSQLQQQQQKHTNKIKSKLNTSARIKSSKDAAHLEDDEPPPPVNLPNIAFPLMHAVPKFDIALPSMPVAATMTNPAAKDVPKVGQAVDDTKSRSFNSGDKSGTVAFAFNINNNKPVGDIIKNSKPVGDIITTAATTKPAALFASTDNANANATTVKMNFKFSAPLEVKGSSTSTQFITPMSKNYKFSAPTTIAVPTPFTSSATYSADVKSPMMVPVPPLKSGSVLDALKPYSFSSTATKTVTTTSSSTIALGGSFGDQFKKSSDQWECQTCLVRNTQETSKCVACETPRSTTKVSAFGVPSFGNQFKKADSEWECDACMVRNKKDVSKCIACETPRKGATKSATAAVPLLPPIGNSFGNAFKPKANTWECPTCLINNKNECNECVACCTKKPGTAGSSGASSGSAAPAPSTTFKFGFTSSTTPTGGISTEATAATAADVGFKSLAAAQKASKWECEACMTRNDATRQKCICCEQAKPGTQTVSDAVPKFAFGATAASKYTFGFGTPAAAVSTNGTTATTATIATQQKTEESTVKSGFVFGSAATVTAAPPATSGGFTFGIKPTTTIASKTSEASKSAGDVGVKTTAATDSNAGSKFGAAVAAGTTFSFGLPTSKTVDSATSATTSTTTTTSPAPASVKFNLSSAEKPDTTDGLVSAKPSTDVFGSGVTTTSGTGNSSNKGVGGFQFGAPVKSTDPSKVDGAVPGFAFKSPTVAAATSSNAAIGAFGTSTVTTTTAAIKPMFSFGSTTPATSTATTAALATSNTTTAHSTTAPIAAGGFNFGGSTPAKSLFGSDIVASAAVEVTAAAATTTPSTAVSQATFSTNKVFGSFGASGSAGFGNAASTVKAPTSTTTTTTSATFGNFGAAATTANVATTNVFGQGESKPIASAAPIFGSTSGTAAAPVTSSSSPITTPFVFGSASSMANNSSGGGGGSSSTNNNTGGTANSWPKNSFIFGASAAPGTNASTTATSSEAPKSVFGSFGAAQSVPASAAPSIFGNMTSTGTNTQSTAPPTFGSAASGGATNIFGSVGSTTVASPSSGAANVFGNNSAPSAAFGSTTFGNSSSGVSSATVFGATAAGQSAAFGGFGTAALASTSTNDGASAAKKSEPAFNFGANSANSTNQQGSFNFGSNAGAPKPAFNFGLGSTPAFNFTGGVETQAVKPFQFGSTPLAPVFNFSGGAVEATPNAPFQFNAGAAPASNNIFAPAPTPGAQSAQQARRKIRQPTRRLTPR